MKREGISMNKKGFIAEIFIVGFVVILLFFSVAINLQSNPKLKDEKFIEKTQKSIGYSVGPVSTAPTITLTGEERADMCKLAAKQAGVQEDGSPRDGYTPYHKWAAGYYTTGWYTNPDLYNYWCVMFVNWCAYHAKLDVVNNYAINANSNSAAREFYDNIGRLSTKQSDAGLERGWISSHGSHMRLYVDLANEWVDGNSYDGSEPSYYYVSYNNRSRDDFKGWCKPYYRSKITYYKNGGSIANEGNYTKYIEEKNFTLPTPTKSGSNFGGWYDNAGFSGTAIKTISSTSILSPVCI
jgi:hypothetical protein